MGTRGRGPGPMMAPVVLALVGTALGATSAMALSPDRSAYVPSGLSQTITTEHFSVHYAPATPSPEPGMSIGAYAALGAGDFEEAYGRHVAGGGLQPNAGLRAPVADDDGRTDVYIAAPNDRPQMSGGIVYADFPPHSSAYVFMTPDLSRRDFRFRSAHELMHVIQNAYASSLGDGLIEAFANWATEWAMPEIDPLDSNFFGEEYPLLPHPWLPLDCTHSTWKGSPCGDGYWQWLFVQAQVEDFGPGFVSGYYERSAAAPGESVSSLLDQQLRASSGGAQGLRERFAAYAHDVWDPSRWTTGSIARLRDELGRRPASYLWSRQGPAAETLPTRAIVDHLAARYVLVKNSAPFANPGDRLELTWSRPEGLAAPVVPLVNNAGLGAWTEGPGQGGVAATASVPFGPGVDEVVLPLVNDSLVDDRVFTFRLSIVPERDVRPPRTSIVRRPRRRTASRRARFAFRADERARFRCRIDRRRFRRCGRRVAFRVGPGRHRIAVRAIDLAGNADPTPARFRWKVVAPR